MKDWLRDIRIEAKKSQEDVAVEAGVSQQFYSLIENGSRVPSVKTAQAIANILGFNWTRFFESEQEAS